MSDVMGAGAALAQAAIAALDTVAGLSGAYEGAPVQAASPFAVVEAGPERDWGHKSGAGREVRLAIILRDQGERPARLRALAGAAAAAIEAMEPALTGWRIVTLVFVRSNLVAEARGRWAAVSEYRARMLAE